MLLCVSVDPWALSHIPIPLFFLKVQQQESLPTISDRCFCFSRLSINVISGTLLFSRISRIVFVKKYNSSGTPCNALEKDVKEG